MRRHKRQLGSAIVEMTFVGIPLIFMLIAVFEVSRGMWIYHTLSYTAREASRFVSLHGQNCQTASNSCGVTADPGQGSTTCGSNQDLASFINCASTGLVPNQVTVRFTSITDNWVCLLSDMLNGSCPGAQGGGDDGGGGGGGGGFGEGGEGGFGGEDGEGGGGGGGSAGTCLNTSFIPSCGGNGVGSPVSVSVSYPFNSAISMFWPGAKSVAFGKAILGATSQDVIEY